MTETIDSNAEFGAGHMFSVGKKDLLIRRKTLFKTKLVQTVPLKDFIKIEFVSSHKKEKNPNTASNSFRGKHVTIEYKEGDGIAKTQYYTKFKKLEFEELQKAIQEGRKQLITSS